MMSALVALVFNDFFIIRSLHPPVLPSLAFTHSSFIARTFLAFSCLTHSRYSAHRGHATNLKLVMDIESWQKSR